MNSTTSIRSLTPGVRLPTIADEKVTRERILQYAGASGDFNPMHVDEVTNVGAGLGGVFAHGMLGTGLLGRVVTDVIGDIPLASLCVRCTKIVRPGDVLTSEGSVVSREVKDGKLRVTFELRATDQTGDVTHHGTASVVVPMEEIPRYEGEALDGSHPLVQWRAIG